MTGSRKQLFISSTRSHARRYDMPSAMPALVIDPVSRIASSNRILPGPTARSLPRSTRKVSRAAATLVAPIPPRPTTPIETAISTFVKSDRHAPAGHRAHSATGRDGNLLEAALIARWSAERSQIGAQAIGVDVGQQIFDRGVLVFPYR